ncbi:hypothetical protein JCM30471_21670 [Desulfuromonas carbonis]|uniref:AsmA family protein n=1 Tax=Desulfuromonas sp. DDH964 TaxID=1823759 RepID=UPI00078DFB70|nr:AsmA family protein [Desulfuromonas sp. DDH964]AMV73746.1 hypothetical protein DBW_3448 [Desulfuromonas sp. DDH964]
MAKPSKIILMTGGGLVGLLLLGAAALLLFVDVNTYKPRLERAASAALGMEVAIGGRLGLRFSPGLVVTLRELHLRQGGAEIVTAEEASLGIALLPLLQREVRVRSITVRHPRITLERNRTGQFNFTSAAAVQRKRPALELARLALKGATLVYADGLSGTELEARDCDLELHHLRLAAGGGGGPLQSVSFTAKLACKSFGDADLSATALGLAAAAKTGVIELQPVAMTLFGARGTGRLHADFTGESPHYSLDYQLPQFPIGEFFQTLGTAPVASGTMDFTAQLSLHGKSRQELRRSLAGEISLRGRNIILKNRDLDAELDRFESSQSFNLVDVGAFFIAGPLGVLVTKGYNFASLLTGAGGSSEIRTLVSDWQVEQGVAQARDAALATGEHRLALQGGLDFASERFVDLTVAMIDAKGCALVEQRITGSFQQPVVEKPNFFATLTGPAMQLIRQGLSLFPGGECEVFYSGSVAPPP